MDPTPLLFTLPTELLLQILTHLHPIRGFLVGKEEAQRRGENALRAKGLHSLTLTSRSVNKVATPHLYQGIIQTEANHQLLSTILRTFDENPPLAHHVSYIEQLLPSLYITTAESTNARAFLPASSWPLLWRSLARAPWGPLVDSSVFSRPPAKLPDLWSSEFNGKYPHRVNRAWEIGPRFNVGVEALLAVALNVVDLALTTPSEETTNMMALRAWPPGKQRRLWMAGSCEWSDVDAFFASPREYRTRYEPGDEVYQCTWPFPHLYDYESEEIRFRAPMVEISLEKCNASPPSVELFLSRCDALQRFTCRWGEAISARASRKQSIIDLEAINGCLQAHVGSLEQLVLDTTWYAANPDSVTQEVLRKPVFAIGNLSSLVALRYLEVTPLMLWGSQGPRGERHLFTMLPVGLEVLVVKLETEDEALVFRELGRWAADGGFRVGFPRLRVVECVVVSEYPTVIGWKGGMEGECRCVPVCDEDALGVEDVFRVVGVEMMVWDENGVSCQECRERRMGY